MLVCALASLGGCASVLGFEDIRVEVPADARADVAPDTSPPAGHCRPTANPDYKYRLGTLGNRSRNVDLAPRLSRDELTIVFTRMTANEDEDTSFTTRAVISTRAAVGLDFEEPRDLPQAAVETASLTADATRIYFARPAAGLPRRELATALTLNAESQPVGVGVAADVRYPVFSEVTSELYFSAARVGTTYSIFRAKREGEAFQPATHIDTIEEPTPGSERLTSYDLPIVSDDGLHLYFSTYTTLPDGGDPKPERFMVASRADVGAPFANPMPVEGVDPNVTTIGWVSPDECRFYSSRLVDGEHRIYAEERSLE